MNRSLPWILVGAMAVSACAGPIETRALTHQVLAAAEQKQFALSPKNSPENRDLAVTRDLVAKSLIAKGYQSSPDASILVHVALSIRPADIAVDGGDKESTQSIAIAKPQKRFQSCKDQEHRLTISLFDQSRGAKLYAGSAAEYHCNGTIAQSAPFLIDSALSGLDSDPTEAPQSAILTRQGIE
jgi:hypothetical protein